MNLWEKLKNAYPELTDDDFHPIKGSIKLRNDSDGVGDYIEKWDYDQPIPNGLTLGKPSA